MLITEANDMSNAKSVPGFRTDTRIPSLPGVRRVPRGTNAILELLRNYHAPRSAPYKSWAASVLQSNTSRAHLGRRAFRCPLPTGHNYGAKEAAHAGACAKNHRAVGWHCPWGLVRHVTHVRCRAPKPSSATQQECRIQDASHARTRDRRGQVRAFGLGH